MVRLTNGVDDCEFSTYNPAMMGLGSKAESCNKPCIRINGMFIIEIEEKEFGDSNLLERVFSKWCRYNYPPFWRAPLGYIFGRRKCYEFERFRYS